MSLEMVPGYTIQTTKVFSKYYVPEKPKLEHCITFWLNCKVFMLACGEILYTLKVQIVGGIAAVIPIKCDLVCLGEESFTFNIFEGICDAILTVSCSYLPFVSGELIVNPLRFANACS